MTDKLKIATELERAEIDRITRKVAEVLQGEAADICYSVIANMLARLCNLSEEPLVAYAAAMITTGQAIQLSIAENTDNGEGDGDERDDSQSIN